jgi:hypothetical protein
MVEDLKSFLENEVITNVPNMVWIVLGIFILIIYFAISKKIRNKRLLETVTKPNRGTKSERDLVLKLLKSGISPDSIFHDLYVRKYSGKFSQIDLVIASEVGIIVIEVKDYSGWIFGNGKHTQWTQVLAYGRDKYRFYNPILQNKKHIEDLRKQSEQFSNLPFYSVVVFYGDCELKDISFVPRGTYIVKANRIFEVFRIIYNNNQPVSYTNKYEIDKVLREAMYNGENPETQTHHIENVKDMLGKHRVFD